MSIKVKMQVKKVVYPKDGIIEIGSYSILGCKLLETMGKQKVTINKYGTFTLKCSSSPAFNIYDEYMCEMDIDENSLNSQYGVSYNLISVEEDENPSYETENGKRAFLESILTKRQVDNLYAIYPDPYELIKAENVVALAKCKGIKKDKARKLIERYKENIVYAEIMVQLKEYKLSRSIMRALLNKYETPKAVIKKVKENIYVLADEVSGIGFKKCDAIALASGIPPDSPMRLKAYMGFMLSEQAQNGNTWVTPKQFFESIEKTFNGSFDRVTIANNMNELYNEKILMWDEEKTRIALRRYYNMEREIHIKLKSIISNEATLTRNFEKEDEILKQIEIESGFNFTEEQVITIKGVLDNKVSVVTGGAGCGKSTIIKAITTILGSYGSTVELTSFSGKAASRILEATGFEGKTLHRLLGSKGENYFARNEEEPLECNCVIIDEASFLGADLFLHLLRACTPNMKIILVGDTGQLPSISIGNLFQDIINSNQVPSYHLTKIHRQASKSGIITSSIQIRNQSQIFGRGWYGQQIFGELQDFLIDIYSDRQLGIPKLLEHYSYFVKSLEDVPNTQILLSMKNSGECCTFQINNLIQQKLNPPKHENQVQIKIVKNGNVYNLRHGDRVINVQNMYDAKVYTEENEEESFFAYGENGIEEEFELDDLRKPEQVADVYNGFSGTIVGITEDMIVVKFDLIEQEILYEKEDFSKLELSYAVTVFKAQGSAWENAIVLMDYSSYHMNTKELLYTGITRAIKKCVLMGEGSAISQAIKTSATNNKQTFLASMLKGEKI